MGQSVQLEDGSIHNFPDDATPDEMTQALSSIPAANTAPLSFGDKLSRAAGILGSDIKSIPGKLVNSAVGAAIAAPSEIPGYFQQATHNPGRVVTNLMQGVGNLETSGMNLSTGATEADYLAHLGLITPEQAAKVPRIPSDYVSKQLAPLLGAQQPGDVLEQSLPGMAALPTPEVGALAGRLAGLGKVADARRKLSSIEETAKTAADAYAAASAQEDLIKSQAKVDIGKQTPEDIQRTINQKSEALQNVNNHIDALSHQMENLPKPAIGEATTAREQAEQHLNAANEIQNSTQLAADKADQDIADYLNVGGNHDVEVAKGLQKAKNTNEKYWSQRYSALQSNLQDAQFKMPETSENAIDMNSIIQKLRAGVHPRDINATESELSPELKGVLDKAPTSKDIMVSDFLDKYKDFRDARNDLITDLKNAPSAADRSARLKAYADSAPMQDTMQKALEEGMGQFAQEFKEINQGYSQTVFPLRNNEHIIMATKKGRLPANMINALRGRAEGQAGVGQGLVRRIIQNDPEMLRNVIGQRYAANPEEIHNPNSMTQEYLNKMPQLTAMQKYRDTLHDSLDKAKENVDLAHSNHKLAIEAEKQEMEKLGNTNRKQEKLQSQLGKHYDQIKKLQDELPQLKSYLDKTNDARLKTNQTLAEKVRTEKEYKAALEKYTAAQSNIKKLIMLTKLVGTKIGKGSAVAGAAIYGAKHLYDLFTPEE